MFNMFCAFINQFDFLFYGLPFKALYYFLLGCSCYLIDLKEHFGYYRYLLFFMYIENIPQFVFNFLHGLKCL